MEQMPFHQKELVSHPFPFIVFDSPKKPFWFPLHWHEQIEILCVLEGNLKVLINEKTWEGRQGDIFIVDTGLIHGFSDPGPEASVRIFQFGREIFDEPLAFMENQELRKPIFSRTPRISPSQDCPVYPLLETILTDINREFQKREQGYRFAIKSELYKLVAFLLRSMDAGETVTANRITNERNHTRHLEQIFSFMYSNFDNPNISLEDTALEVGLSKYYLTRFLKEQTGLGYHDHLSRVRLSRAR